MTVEPASEDGDELSRAVVVGAGLAVVSTGAGVALGAGAGGTDATVSAVFATGLDVEGSGLEAGCSFELGALLLVPAVTELWASVLTLARAGAERGAVSRFERLAAVLLAALLGAGFGALTLSDGGGDAVAALRLGACGVAALASVCVAMLSAATGAGVFAAGLPASATTAGRFADGGGVLSESLRL